MKRTIFLLGLVTLLMAANVFAQQIVMPRESNKQEIMQTVGDAKISIVYYRPNVKGRLGKIYGCKADTEIQQGNNTGPCLVPNGQVWRAGANDNTVIEFSTDVKVNGQPLPAGKYAFFAIPDKKEWTLIFNKINNEWGAFTYKKEQDALRVMVTPMVLKTPRETLSYEFDTVFGSNAKINLSWEKLSVPFTVDVGDINGRVLNQLRAAIKTRKTDDARPLNQAAGFVLNSKISASYNEALGWLDESTKMKETFGNLNTKARLLAEMGKKADAIATAEKAIQIGKAATPAANTSGLEDELKKWKANK